MSDVRLCRICHEKPCQPARARVRDYICSRCYQRQPTARAFRISEKGKIREQRYRASAKGRARTARYQHTEQGRRLRQELEARRIRLCERTFGYADTVDEARAIRAYIKARLLEFKSRQSERAKAEGDSDGAVSTEATPGGD